MISRMKIESFERCYPSRAKKIFRSNLNMKTYDEFIPNMKCATVGNLPPELIKFFPKETRERDIKNFQNVLGSTTNFLRASYHKLKFKPGFHWVDENYRQSRDVKDWIKECNTVLNALLKNKNPQISAKLEYVERGAWKNVFKLSIFDKDGNKIMKDKALGIYHNPQNTKINNNNRHNNYAETNFWEFLKFWAGHKLDNTEYTRHYISDMKFGYALTEFANYEIKKTTSSFDIKKLLHIKCIDLANNSKIFGKYYDAGAHVKCKNFIDDKVVLKFYKKIMNRSPKELPQVLSNFESMAKNPKTQHNQKIKKAIELALSDLNAIAKDPKNPQKDKLQSALNLFKKLQSVDNNIL